MSEKRRASSQRNGNLSIPLPFKDALKAATEVKPEAIPDPPKRKPSRRKKAAKKG